MRASLPAAAGNKAAIDGLQNIEVLGAIPELTARLRGNPVLGREPANGLKALKRFV